MLPLCYDTWSACTGDGCCCLDSTVEEATWNGIEYECPAGKMMGWMCMRIDPVCEGVDAGMTTVPCGDMTCGPSQYCLDECLCCGIPDAGPPASRQTCVDLPGGCSPDDICSCDLGAGACDAITRTVSVPCA